MKRVLNLYKKDIILGIKDVFILLEIAFSVIMMLLILLVIPKSIEQKNTVFIYDKSGMIVRLGAEIREGNMQMNGQIFVDSREAVVEGMIENKSAVGLIIEKDPEGKFRTELLTQPYSNASQLNYLEVVLEDIFSVLSPPFGAYPPDVYRAVSVIALQDNLRDSIPFNRMLLPIIIVTMIGIVGLFAMVSMIAQEKVDDTIRAYRVAPSSIYAFIVSKHLVLLTISIVTFSVMYLPIIGFGGYLPALLITLLTVIIGSSLGILLGSFYDEPMASFGWVFLLMLVFTLPAISLLAPVFSPDWLRIIPSYYTLFGLDAAMFPDHNAPIIGQSILLLTTWAVPLVLISARVFRSRIRKGGIL